jgi:hypothetical protein
MWRVEFKSTAARCLPKEHVVLLVLLQQLQTSVARCMLAWHTQAAGCVQGSQQHKHLDYAVMLRKLQCCIG